MVFNAPNGQFPVNNHMVFNNAQELPAFDRRGYPQASQAPQVAFQSAYATPSLDSDSEDLDYSGPYVHQQSYNQQYRSSYSKQNGMPAGGTVTFARRAPNERNPANPTITGK